MCALGPGNSLNFNPVSFDLTLLFVYSSTDTLIVVVNVRCFTQKLVTEGHRAEEPDPNDDPFINMNLNPLTL